MSDTTLDTKGVEIAEGDRVNVGVAMTGEGEFYRLEGTITQITEFDVGDGDYGQPVGINPRVTVRYDDGSEESFYTYWTATGPWDDDAPFKCEDVEKVAA